MYAESHALDHPIGVAIDRLAELLVANDVSNWAWRLTVAGTQATTR
jgi:hypothetical protein